MRYLAAAVTLLTLAACNSDGRPSLLADTLCGVRENVCKQRCEPLRPTEALACRRSCEDSAGKACR